MLQFLRELGSHVAQPAAISIGGSIALILSTNLSRRTEKLDSYLDALYILLEDLLRLEYGVPSLRNDDVRVELEALRRHVSFEWLRAAVAKVDELVELVRRNIQKSLALDALAVELRSR